MKKINFLLASLPFVLASCGTNLANGVSQVLSKKVESECAISVGVIYKETPISAPGSVGIAGNCATYLCDVPETSVERNYTQNIDVTTATATYQHMIKITYIGDSSSLTIKSCTVVDR